MQKRLNKPLILFLFLLLGSSFTAHKFYVSHYTIEYKNQDLQITIKVFTDDLEKALQQADAALRIDEGSDIKVLGPKISNYYLQHLHLTGDKAMKLNWVGYELENDLVWVYMEVTGLKEAPKSLEIRCDALTEIYEDQINLFRVDCGALEETFSLRKEESSRFIQK